MEGVLLKLPKGDTRSAVLVIAIIVFALLGKPDIWLAVVERIVVLNFGEVIATGSPAEIAGASINSFSITLLDSGRILLDGKDMESSTVAIACRV